MVMVGVVQGSGLAGYSRKREVVGANTPTDLLCCEQSHLSDPIPSQLHRRPPQASQANAKSSSARC